MSKHTPGPWSYTVDKDRGWDFKLTADHGKTEIVSGCGCCDSPWVSCEADARLIAAAPELLEALENIVKLGEPGRIYELKELGTLVGGMLSIARAAIAKAKGEEQ